MSEPFFTRLNVPSSFLTALFEDTSASQLKQQVLTLLDLSEESLLELPTQYVNDQVLYKLSRKGQNIDPLISHFFLGRLESEIMN